MRRTPHRSLLIASALGAAGLSLTGCASSGGCAASSQRTLVYQLSYTQPQHASMATGGEQAVLASGDGLGRGLFEEAAIVTSRANAELRYAGVD